MYQFKSVLTGIFYLLFQFAVAEHPVNEIITFEMVKERLCVSDMIPSASFTYFENPTFTYCVQKIITDNMKSKTKEIKGIYSLVPNPCLTQPCLPGIAGSIKTEKAMYYLLKDDQFTDESFFWEDIFPQQGDTLIIKGIPGTMTDIKGEKFMVIKISSLIKS